MVILQSVKESRNIYRCITFASQVRYFYAAQCFRRAPDLADHVMIHLGDYNCSVCKFSDAIGCVWQIAHHVI